MYFFVGSQFSDRVPQNVKLPQAQRRFQRAMRTNAELIVFAVKQAGEAEAFGFTRNECCRNLKTALHQYWQHRTMKLHGQSQKARIPRSTAATDRPLNECFVEHVVPLMAIVNRLMEMKPLTEESVTDVLKRWFRVVLVTREEHARLNASGLRSRLIALLTEGSSTKVRVFQDRKEAVQWLGVPIKLLTADTTGDKRS